MLTKAEAENAKRQTATILKDAAIPLTPEEAENIEIADFGLSDLARQGLASAPNDSRFLLGRRQAAQAIDARRPWTVSASSIYDWFSDGRPAWQETQAWVQRETGAGPIIVELKPGPNVVDLAIRTK